MHKRKRLGNPSRILFLLLLHICVCMFLILLVSGSLLLLMPFLSFFSLLFFTTLRPVVIIILFGLFITSRTICFHRNYFSPVKSHNLYANLPSYISPWVKIFFIRSFLRRTQVCYIPPFFFFFERGLTWHYTTLSENGLDRRNKTMIRTLQYLPRHCPFQPRNPSVQGTHW